MAISNATRLSDFGSGIGTAGAVLKVDNTNQRVGIGTTDPRGMLQVGTAITMNGNTGIITATQFIGDGSELTAIVGVPVNPYAWVALVADDAVPVKLAAVTMPAALMPWLKSTGFTPFSPTISSTLI